MCIQQKINLPYIYMKPNKINSSKYAVKTKHKINPPSSKKLKTKRKKKTHHLREKVKRERAGVGREVHRQGTQTTAPPSRSRLPRLLQNHRPSRLVLYEGHVFFRRASEYIHDHLKPKKNIRKRFLHMYQVQYVFF